MVHALGVPVVAGRYTKEPSAEDEGLQLFQAGLSAFWRFWQLATAVAALAVMCAAGQNGVAFQSFQPFIWLVAAMSAVIAWALFNLARDASMLLPKSLRRWLFLLTEFVSRSIQYSRIVLYTTPRVGCSAQHSGMGTEYSAQRVYSGVCYTQYALLDVHTVTITVPSVGIEQE